MDKLLEIKNLHARIGEKEILHGIDLSIGRGEIHAVMGPKVHPERRPHRPPGL